MRPILLLTLVALCACKSAPPRTIRVLATADQHFRARPDWQKVLASRFEAVNTMYRQAVGITWEVANVVEWTNDPAGELEAQRRRLGGRTGSGSIVSVGFTGLEKGDSPGAAVPFDPRVLVVDFRGLDESRNALVLAHQLARIFGAWPAGDAGSIMHVPPGASIDPTTRKCLQIARDADFSKGPDGLPAEKRAELLKLWSDAKAEPKSHPVFLYHSSLGGELLALGLPREAVQPLSTAATLAPSDPGAHYWLGIALAETRQFSPAVAEFRKSLELDPSSVRTLNGLGGVLGFLGRWKESAETFQKAVQLRPGDAGLRTNAGAALVRTPGGFDQGIEQLREALRLDPKNENIRKALAMALEARRQPAR